MILPAAENASQVGLLSQVHTSEGRLEPGYPETRTPGAPGLSTSSEHPPSPGSPRSVRCVGEATQLSGYLAALVPPAPETPRACPNPDGRL